MGVVTQDASSSSSSDDEECGERSGVDHFGGGMVAKVKVKVESSIIVIRSADGRW